MTKTNRAIALAAVGGAVAFGLIYLLLSSAYYPLVVSLAGAVIALAIVAFCIGYLALPSRKEEEHEAYVGDAERLKEELQAKLGQLELKASGTDSDFQALITGICTDVEELLRLVSVNNPSLLLSTTDGLNNYMPQLDDVVSRYITISRDSRRSRNPKQELESSRQALKAFQDGFLVNSLQLAEQGSTVRFRAALQELEASRQRALA